MKEKLAGLGALVSAALASVCCLGPLVLVALGLGGAGLAAGFERYRPFFLGLTALLLGVGFYLTYKKRDVLCENGRCEMRSGSKSMKGALWVITVAALGMATFPNWSPLLFSAGKASVSPEAEKVELSVSGMTCSACAASIEKSLKKVPGVEAASVSLEKARAVVWAIPGKSLEQELLKAIQRAGNYSAKINKGKHDVDATGNAR